MSLVNSKAQSEVNKGYAKSDTVEVVGMAELKVLDKPAISREFSRCSGMFFLPKEGPFYVFAHALPVDWDGCDGITLKNVVLRAREALKGKAPLDGLRAISISPTNILSHDHFRDIFLSQGIKPEVYPVPSLSHDIYFDPKKLDGKVIYPEFDSEFCFSELENLFEWGKDYAGRDLHEFDQVIQKRKDPTYGQEFDQVYQNRKIGREITRLQSFLDLDFDKISVNRWYSKVPNTTAMTKMIESLGELVESHFDCETFGELRETHPEGYERIRDNLLLCAKQCGYKLSQKNRDLYFSRFLVN